MRGEGRIFINYRRADTRWAASRLYDGLGQRFGNDTLFMDVDSIPPGADFVEYLNAFVDRSKAIIVLIGPNWLSLCDDLGRRRLDDPKDFVNIEIRRALQNGLTVIPVLVDGAKMPSEADLPQDLKLLSRRQAVKLGHDTYGQDLDRLTRALGASGTGLPCNTSELPMRHNLFRRLLGRLGLVFIPTFAFVAMLSLQTPATRSDQHEQQLHERAISGRWSSDYGELIWTHKGASYGSKNGRLIGAFDGLNFNGHWIEDSSEHPCATYREGSAAWGTIVLDFDANLEFFQGHWGYCDAVPNKPWTGSRPRKTETSGGTAD